MATALLPPSVTQSVAPSRLSARPVGALPNGSDGSGRTGTVSTTRPVRVSMTLIVSELALAT
jgi:hypothetical protein